MQLEQVESAFARGDSNTAEKQLAKNRRSYGGLAAPRSVDLASR